MSRLAFRLQSIPAASGSVVRIDTASGSNTPADLRTLGGNAIDGAVIRSGSNGGHLPTVLGPDGVTTLYQKTLDYRGQVTGSPVTLTGEDDNPSAPTGGAATTNASQLTSGTLSAARLPDLSGTYEAAGLSAASKAAVTAPYGLAVGKGGCVVPVGVRAHVGFDNPDVTSTSATYRQFHPLSDPQVGAVLPVFSNWQSVSGAGGDFDAGAVPLTVACAVETSDGVVLPFTFNGGNHTVTLKPGQSVAPDMPVAFGDQVSANDKYNVALPLKGVWLRVYASVADANRTDSASTTSGSSVIGDTSILATDAGKIVSGTGLPANSYVGAVTPGTSFVLMSVTTQAAVNATATGTPSITLKSTIPYNMSYLSNADSQTTGTGVDLTLTGSGAVGGGTNGYTYGPSVLLGRARTRKPIAAVLSDSIFDGYSEDFHSTFFGPVARGALNLGLPLVKLSKGGETASQVYVPSGRRYRAVFLDGVTHCIVELGTNDQALTTAANTAGVTAMQTRLTAIGTYLANLGIKPIIVTVPPRGTSTDAFATTTNQTPASGSQITYLASLNDWIRAKPTPYVSVIDLADICMSARNSGLWVIGGTSDGIHPSDALMRGAISTAVQAEMATWTL